MSDKILSVGLDLGTATTQLVLQLKILLQYLQYREFI